MSEIAFGFAAGACVVLGFALRAIAEHEYLSWSAFLARAIVRLAGRIHPASREEWWAEIVEVQEDRLESGLGYALPTLLSSIRLVRATARESSPVLPIPDAPPVLPGGPRVLTGVDTIGGRIRVCRKSMRLSQERLAERCGLHRTYIGCVERDEVNPSLHTILRIAAALDVDPGELVSQLPQPDPWWRTKYGWARPEAAPQPDRPDPTTGGR